MRRLPPPRFVGFLIFASAAFLRGAETPAPAADPVVELPKYVVTDNRELPPPESWRYATIPGFEIITNASDKASQRLIRDFETFRLGLSYVWPVQSRNAFPIALIICGRGAKFDAFIPKDKDAGPEMARASLFLKQGDKSAIVIDYQSKVIQLLPGETDDPASGTDSSQLNIEHDKQLNREYIRYLLSQAEPRLPAWFEEGLTQIVMRMTVEPDLIEFGRLEDPNTVSAMAGMVAQVNALTGDDDAQLAGAPADDRDFNAALRRKPLMKLQDFFAVTHENPVASNPLGNNIWAKQAYAFVHMCLYGRGGRFQKPFTQFLIRSTREPVTEQMFKECFRFPKGNGFKEMSYSDMLIELRGYCDMSDYKVMGFKAKKGEPPLQMPKFVTLREATQSEVGRIKGDALLLAGNKEKARTELIAPYIRGERDPNLLASLALYDHAAGEDVRARKLLDAATAAKTTDPEAYLELARFRLADAIAKPEGADGNISEAQSKAVVDLLIGARRQTPQLPAVYETMAETWLRRGTPVKKEELGTVIDGLQVFPGRMKLAYQIGVLANAAGANDVALAMANHGIKYSPDPKTKARFEQFKATLPPMSGAPAPAQATAKTADAAPKAK